MSRLPANDRPLSRRARAIEVSPTVAVAQRAAGHEGRGTPHP